ncbi:hypothetical protein MKQ70_15285 [Chitinophaga sedimenti]|uniref:hypothetical protein n=1 Tax=Chitinophaga sedimenti TaxID=2033606 RepID=UPI0020052DD2|nr:hypothetical protein [Chitinophaga sedimenti]MCK7556305.1 hypothetical protein [Chitinophaga sedimenti]
MMRYLIILLLCSFSAAAQINTNIFKQHGVTGSTTIYDYQTKNGYTATAGRATRHVTRIYLQNHQPVNRTGNKNDKGRKRDHSLAGKNGHYAVRLSSRYL